MVINYYELYVLYLITKQKKLIKPTILTILFYFKNVCIKD